MKTRTTITFTALAAACLAGVSAYAGTPAVAPGKPIKDKFVDSAITGDIGINTTSNYISKGIVWQNQGLILQPYTNLHFRVWQAGQGDGSGDSITVDLGIESVYTDHQENAFRLGPNPLGVGLVSSTGNWLEFNFRAGLTFDFSNVKISPYYKIYQSPQDYFANTYAAGIVLAYDDSDLLGNFALHPYALVELMLQGSRGNNGPGILNPAFAALNLGVGNNSFHGRGQYYEVGITPSHSYGDLTLSLPIKGGFGTGGFYLGNRGFGFFSVGLDAEYVLNFVPESLGRWSIHSGVTYVRLGGRNTVNPVTGVGTGAAGFAPAFGLPGGTVNSNNQVVFGGGLRVAF